MKLNKYILMAAGSLALLGTACDDVSEADRFIPVEKVEAEKNVLIMEFTGQMCSNCPTGAAVVNGLIADYPGHVFAICMHPNNTPFTIVPEQFNIGLTSTAADEYYKHYKPGAFPAACIDGAEPNTNVNAWTTPVLEALASEAPANIELKSNYDAATRKLTVDYDVEFTSDFDKNLNIVGWVIEDNMVGFQYSSIDGYIYDYTHNHVLRAAINGTWGTELAGFNGGFKVSQDVAGNMSMTLDEAWKAENCLVVVALMTPDKRFVQCQETHVTH